MHYREIPALDEETVEWFWSHINVGLPHECWPFKRLRPSKKGYGVVQIGGENFYAHRVAFVAGGKKFTDGPLVRHFVCGNPACCNPAHLESGTHQDNMDDKERHGRTSRGLKHSQALGPSLRALPTTKLTVESAREIHQLRADGWFQYELAARFGVTCTTIQKVLRGRTWRETHPLGHYPAETARARTMAGGEKSGRSHKSAPATSAAHGARPWKMVSGDSP